MQRPQVPGSVTLGRVLLIVESVLWLLGAVAIGGVGVWFISASPEQLTNRLQQAGYTGANLSASALVIGGTVLFFAIVILVISIIGIWSGAAMGRLTTGPRVSGLVLASLGLLLGIVGALGSTRTTVHMTTGPSFRGSPIPGIIIIAVNLLIIWALGFSGRTRAAFRSLPPPGYAGMAPAGYGPPPAYVQPGAADAFPPPPPPPPPPPSDGSAGSPYDFPPPPPAP